MQLDHVFVLVAEPAPLLATLGALGLKESYRRVHPGQGTRNVCFAFDNAFLEVLWIYAPEQTLGPQIRRMAFGERLQQCPYGLAWRGPSPLPTWEYRPPYLPAGMCIPVATASDDAAHPLLFRSPGEHPPSAWPPERRGPPQPWSTLHIRTLEHPGSPALQVLLDAGLIGALGGSGLTLALSGGSADHLLQL